LLTGLREIWLIPALLVSCLPRLAVAIGEQVGRIQGVITEAQTGLPVPGATVTASSPALITGSKNVTSREDGS